MDLSDEAGRSAWWRRLGAPVAGRKVVLGIAPAAALVRPVAAVRAAGATEVMVLAAGTGAGSGPSPEDARVVPVPTPRYASMSESVRDEDRLVRGLPDDVQALLEDWDREREALWWGSPFVQRASLHGRRVVGGRPRRWAELEDKTLVDPLWREVGYDAAPHAVVDVADPEAWDRAVLRLDVGHGVVCAGDARGGVNGGGDFVRRVCDGADLESARSFFVDRCDRVRVQPFLDGVPCSIHGVVMPDGTAAFRPVELAILRSTGPGGRRFVFGGQGTTWDPPEAERARMRALVHDVGALLSQRVGYRGAFGIDGVLTRDGFRPTELNPRFSGGFAVLAGVVDPVGFMLLQTALVEGVDPGIGAEDLEGWALPVMDRTRTAAAKAVSDRLVVDRATELTVTWTGSTLDPDPEGDVTVQLGPTGAGTFTRVSADDVLGTGDRLGPFNAALTRLLDRQYDTGFGNVEPAPDVSRGRQ